MDGQVPQQPSEKELLEIQKLRADMRTANFNKWAQFTNPIVLLLSGAAVLFLFQRPQLTEMEKTRQYDDKGRVANVLLQVQQIADPQRKREMIDALSGIWPEYHLGSIALADQASAQTDYRPGESLEARCETLNRKGSELSDVISALSSRLEAEVPVFGNTGMLGEGPFARAIRIQLGAAQGQLAEQKLAIASAHCR